jgi:23S rRNA (guanosine2251-2'-O)-methyltransferase
MQKTEILFGIHPVIEAIRAKQRKIFEVFIEKGKASERLENIRKLSENSGIPVKDANAAMLKSFARTHQHQGVSARVSPLKFQKLSRLLHELKSDLPPLLVMLDGVTDPHNLGALIRTALCAGVRGVVIPKNRSAMPTPVVSAVSSGAMEHMPLVVETNMARTMEQLKSAGIWIAGLDAGAKDSIYSQNLAGPLALVLGSEEKGIRRLVRSKCDFLLSIPQTGPVESLNVSVAGALVMYEAVRQRTHGIVRKI